MVFSYTTTSDQSTNKRGNIYFARGTWTAGNAAPGAASTIVTPFSHVIFSVLVNTEAVSESPTWENNKNGAGAAAAGSIGITAFADQVNNVGTWYAEGLL